MSVLELSIVGSGVISPYGVGLEAFGQGISAGRVACYPVEQGDWLIPWPIHEACWIRQYRVADILGTRAGTRVLDRTAALAVGASALALSDSRLKHIEGYQDKTGLVIGTGNGSLSRTIDYISETIGTAKPYLTSPEAFPNTVMNFAAGQAAIWHKLRALNATISGGRVAGVLSLKYARRALFHRHADAIVVGSIEELSPHVAWGIINASSARGDPVPMLGEGAAMFALRRSDAPDDRLVLSNIMAIEAGYAADSAKLQSTLEQCIRRALAQSSVRVDDVDMISAQGSAASYLGRIEEDAISNIFKSKGHISKFVVADLLGDCYSAAGSLQLAALLVKLPPAAIGIVTSLNHSGVVGCIVVKGGVND